MGASELLKLPGIQPNRIGTGRDGTLDSLADPPDGIGRESRLVDDFESVDGQEQGADTFLDQIGMRYSTAFVPFRNVGNEAHVRHRQTSSGLLVAIGDGS